MRTALEWAAFYGRCVSQMEAAGVPEDRIAPFREHQDSWLRLAPPMPIALAALPDDGRTARRGAGETDPPVLVGREVVSEDEA